MTTDSEEVSLPPLTWKDEAPIRYLFTFYHLFFTPKFAAHRLLGLSYLLQYAATVILYFYDYEMFKSSPLVITLPISGVLLSVTAIYTFTFLAKRKKDPGYYSDKSALNYAFVVENSFFAGLLCFQWLYYHDALYKFFKATVIIENVVVFLPYIFRPLWPKTSFRDSLYSDNNKSTTNAKFFFIGTWITKIFYGKYDVQTN